MLDFKPPKDTPLLIQAASLCMPLILKCKLRDTRVTIVGDGLARFRALAGQRTVICPNHAHRHDPHILFEFGRQAGESFNYLAAREVFDYDRGWNGFWLQHLGCYSVVRGAVDRESFKTTKSLIVSGKKKLVVFPEGEISGQNDTLMPLETGVAQMSFWALDELKKSGADGPVNLLPVAVKYTFKGDIRKALSSALTRLEDRLALMERDPSASIYLRLRNVCEKILLALEHEYDYKPSANASLNDRLVGLRAFVLKNIAQYLQVNLPADARELDWIRILRNSLDDIIFEEGAKDESYYEHRIHEEKAAKVKGFYRDLDRVVNFIAIFDGYLRERMTQERFAHIIDRLQNEVFGAEVFIQEPRVVLLDVGRPINIADYYQDYKLNKKATLVRVNEDLSRQLSMMLEALDQKRQAVFVE